MKFAVLLAALALGTAAVAASFQDMAPPAPLDEHKWLMQLVGEWTTTSEATTEPGAEPTHTESTESVRSIGGLWIVGETSATHEGVPFTALLTLGYDPARKAFVGTWIDSVQTYMWSYVGTLDEARKVLTLEAEGPSWDDPSKTCRFRDAIELVDADRKRLTSSLQMEDGSWVTFLTADYRRKR